MLRTELTEVSYILRVWAVEHVVRFSVHWNTLFSISCTVYIVTRVRFPLFHWVTTLDKLFTYIASPVSQLQETGVQKGVFGA